MQVEKQPLLKRRTRAVIYVTIIVLTSLGSIASAVLGLSDKPVEARSAVAALVFKETMIDLGEIGQGESKTGIFMISNLTGSPMFLSSMECSCACTTPDFQPQTLAPAGRTEVSVTLRTGASRGKVCSSCFLHYNRTGQEDQQEQALRVCATVAPEIVLSHEIVHFSIDGPRTFTVSVSPGRLSSFELPHVSTSHSAFQVKQRAGDAPSTFDLEITFDPEKWDGFSKSSSVFVLTSSEVTPSLVIPLQVASARGHVTKP